jgi:hypothetical protein
LASKRNLTYCYKKLDLSNRSRERLNTLSIFSFSNENIHAISKMAINKTGTKIALVTEVSLRYLAKGQLERYKNKGIDTFLKTYAKDAKAYRFRNKLEYKGIENMCKNYVDYFNNTPDLHCK